MSQPAYGGVKVADFVLVHAAALESRGLDELTTLTIGVGKTAAAVSLHGLLRNRPETRAVLLFGVAGAYPDRHRSTPAPVRRLEVCVVGRDGFGDEGVETPSGFERLQLATRYATATGKELADAGVVPAHRRMAQEAAALLAVPIVNGTTVSTCSGTDDLSQRLHGRTGADIETMEGAAVAYVCQKHEVPLLHVRAISNWTGDRDAGEWNLGAAVDALAHAVRRLVTAT